MSEGDTLSTWLEQQGLSAGAEALRSSSAVPSLGTAGEDAMARAAFLEAQSQLERAIEILDEFPEPERRLKDSFRLRTRLAECYVVTKGHSAPETRRAFENALDIGERIGEPVTLTTVLAGLISAAAQRAEYATAQAYADRLLAVAKKSGGAFERGWAHFRQGHIQFYQGDLRAARRSFEQALAVGAKEPLTIGGTRLSGAIMVLLPLTMALMGDFAASLKMADEYLAEAEAAGIPHNLAYVKLGAISPRMMIGDVDAAEPLARSLLALCSEHKLLVFEAFASIYFGWCMRKTGKAAESIEHGMRGIETLAAIGTKGLANWFRALVAETMFDAGAEDQALAMVEEAVKMDAFSPFGTPIALRVKSKMLLSKAAKTKGDAAIHIAAQAEETLRSAIQKAHRCGALVIELRAATALARQFKARQDLASARQTLAPVYERFKEGFDTPYLVEAKAVLDGL